MNKIRLVKPTIEFECSIATYKNDFERSGESLAGGGSLRNMETVLDWLENLDLLLSEDCPTDKVPSTTFLAIDDEDEVVGLIDLRHHINHPILSTWGGHVGYSVRPAERKKGYATEMLSQLLLFAKSIGLSKLLITCDSMNIGSKKTILNNGGVFEGVHKHEDGLISERYWISL